MSDAIRKRGKLKVYLAARFSAKEQVKLYAKELADVNIECTSTWLDEAADPKTTLDKHSDSYLLNTAMVDIKDMLRSNAVVFFAVDPKEPTPRGGRHFELGFAYGKGIPCIVVGPKENIFHYLPDIKIVPTFEDAKMELLSKSYELQKTRSFGDYSTCTVYPSIGIGGTSLYRG